MQNEKKKIYYIQKQKNSIHRIHDWRVQIPDKCQTELNKSEKMLFLHEFY